jgi:hypothetical protein
LEERWTPLYKSDLVLVGKKLSTLTEGESVRLSKSPGPMAGESIDKTSNNAGGE